MNIALYVGILDQVGGAEIASLRLAERLGMAGHEVSLLTTQSLTRWRTAKSIIDYAKGIRVIRLPVWQRSERIFAQMLFAQALWAMPLLLRGIQMLHLRGLTPETVALARIARRMGIRTLCTPMASGVYGDVARFPASIRHSFSVFDWISALTEPMRDEVIRLGYLPERISVIPNGVDTNFFKPQQPPSEPHVVFVGQFRPEKRINILLEAWAQIQSACPRARLTLVGGGHYLPDYRHLALQLGIEPNFVPNMDTAGVLAQLQANSIFVMPGVSEGMSNALLEAMAVGLAPIAADTPANRAIITPEVDGLVYSAESPQALAWQIKRLIDDDTLRRRLGTAARETVVRRFTLDGVVERHLAMYQRLLGETP
jgi:glycosyltransferase involved in cell wall biosynthesis